MDTGYDTNTSLHTHILLAPSTFGRSFLSSLFLLYSHSEQVAVQRLALDCLEIRGLTPHLCESFTYPSLPLSRMCESRNSTTMSFLVWVSMMTRPFPFLFSPLRPRGPRPFQSLQSVKDDSHSLRNFSLVEDFEYFELLSV